MRISRIITLTITPPIVLTILGLLCLPLSAWAADEASLGLPLPAEVAKVIDALPQIRAAQGGIAVAQANARLLTGGNREWSLRTSVDRRNDRLAGRNFIEQEIALERPIRWFGKAEKDASIANELVVVAAAALRDAQHEARRELIKAWFNVQRERISLLTLNEQVVIAEQVNAIALKRLSAGDSARLEARLAQTDVSRARASVQQATQRAELADLEFARSFPGLLLVPLEAKSTPGELGETSAEWAKRILLDNDELELAEAERKLARLRADKAANERFADPTVALRASRERGGQETVIGFSVTIPIPGQARQAEQAIALGNANVQADKEALTRVKVETAAHRVASTAASTRRIWQTLQQIQTQTQANSQTAVKAYSLGESSIADTLAARRVALDAAIAADVARVDAFEALARLLLDAHAIWAEK
jgi:outer membrane protein, heavy metal efflux system